MLEWLVFLFGVVFLLSWVFFPPSRRVGAGEMWWLGSAPKERQSLGNSSPYSALLGRNSQVFLHVSCGGPGLAAHIQLIFGGWREAAASYGHYMVI